MRYRSTAVVALCAVLGVALVAGCSASSDYEAAPKQQRSERRAEVPHWIREGVRLAKATKAARLGRSGGSNPIVLGSTKPTTATGGLPPRQSVVSALVGNGLTDTQAGCIYDNIAANPGAASDITALLSGLSGSPDAAASLASLSPESSTRLLMTIAPCLDQATLVALLAAGQGLGGTDGNAIAQLLGSAQGIDVAQLAGFDPNAVATAVAGALGPEKVRQLQALLSGASSPQSIDPSLLAKLDVSTLDLSKLSKEQTPLLVLALVQGLTEAQKGQLATLTQVKLDELNVDIDPDKLTPEEVGSLLLIISPILAGSLKPTPPTVPPGGDPLQPYIPPGADLSNFNPLVFLNRADVIAGFQRQGVDPRVGTCMFDQLAKMSPSTIAAFFSKDAGPAAAASILLTAISCIAQAR